jgi:hypothetical protein
MEHEFTSDDTSTAVALQRLSGKIDRVLDAQIRQSDDLKFVRDTQEKQRDELSRLTGLNIQDRFVANGTEHLKFDERLNILELARAANLGERKGVEVSAKVIYSWMAIGGLGFTAFVGKYLATGSL